MPNPFNRPKEHPFERFTNLDLCQQEVIPLRFATNYVPAKCNSQNIAVPLKVGDDVRSL